MIPIVRAPNGFIRRYVVVVVVIITLPLGLSAFEQKGCESSHSKSSLGLNPLNTTMTFHPECHGFHKSAFVMVIKGYDSITPLVLRFDAAGGFRIKFQATTYHPPPPFPSHFILSVMQSNILPFYEV